MKIKKMKNSTLKGKFKVESWSALKDYLLHAPDVVVEVHYRTDHQQKVDALKPMAQSNPKISWLSYPEMEKPFFAYVNLKMTKEEELWKALEEGGKDQGPLLLLDHILDARNFGSIMRSAAFYGVSWVVLPKDRQVLLSDASVKTAQAGFARTKVVAVTNLSRFIKRLKQTNYWVFGMDVKGQQINGKIYEYEKLALVMGSEEKGLSRNVSEQCDQLLRIGPMKPGLQSLNVAVATGIILDHIQGVADN